MIKFLTGVGAIIVTGISMGVTACSASKTSNGREENTTPPADETPGGDNTNPGNGNNNPGDGNNNPGDGGDNTNPGDGNTNPGDGNNNPGDGNSNPGDGDENTNPDDPGSTTNKYEAYEQALRTGDGSALSLTELIEGHEHIMSSGDASAIDKIKEVFPNGIEKIPYSAGKSDAHFNSLFDYTGKHTPLFKIGHTTTGAYLIEQAKNEVILSGVNFTTTGNIGEIKNSNIYTDMVKYLTRNHDGVSQLKIGIITNYWVQNDVKTYLDNKIPNNNYIIENVSLSGLTTDVQKQEKFGQYDLIIANSFEDSVQYALESTTPLLMHFESNWWVTKPWTYIFDKFNIFMTSDGGTFRADALAGIHPTNIKEDINAGGTYESIANKRSKEIDSLLDILKNAKLEVTPQTGAYKEKNKDGNPELNWSKVIIDNDGRTVQEAAYSGLKQVESIIQGFDKLNNDIFDGGLDYYKGILLQADYYRSKVEYDKDRNGNLNIFTYNPSTELSTMKKDILPTFKALFADSSVLYSRKSNQAQTDLGDFSPQEDRIRAQQVINKTSTIKAGRDPHNVGSSTGIYIKAGQEVSIKLKTNTTNNLKVRITTLRDGSLRAEWPTRYLRPYSIQSNWIQLKYDEEVKLSSPHGGPLYLLSDSENLANYEIEFKNVLEHPTLFNHNDPMEVAKFSQDIKDTIFNWIDIKSDYAELHMTKESANTSMALPMFNGDVKKYVEYYNKYTIAYNFEFAGYSGDGLTDFTEKVKNWGTSMNLYNEMYDQTIQGRRWTQHYNVEKPTCGDLCSGNPADQWAPYFRPTSWGENHEIGHNIQPGRLKVYDGASTEVSNNIFPGNIDFRLQQDDPSLNYYSTDGNNTQMYFSRTNHNGLFEFLNNEHLKNSVANSGHALWDGDYFLRLTAYHQMKFASQSEDFFTQAYIYHRFIDYYTENDNRWTDEIKTKLKLTTYSRTDARNKLVGGDFFAVLASDISGNDVSEFLEGLGIAVSDQAKQQIVANGHTNKLGKGLFYVYEEKAKYEHFQQIQNGEFNGIITLVQMAMPTMNDFVPFGSGKTYKP